MFFTAENIQICSVPAIRYTKLNSFESSLHFAKKVHICNFAYLKV